MSFNAIPELVQALSEGKMIVLVDDEDRENEGDIVMAAQSATPENINFTINHARGLTCMPMSVEWAEKLQLDLMVPNNRSRFNTNFTTSIEAAEGVTTGISASDRSKTLMDASAEDVKATDVVQPGHIFPIIAQPGGVLTRAGHTEASVDLVTMAGFTPAAVVVEILKADGTMARRPDLEDFAKAHDLKMGSIADLIRYRVEHEPTIETVSCTQIDTQYGKFECHVLKDTLDGKVHFALTKGDINSDEPTLVRVHHQDMLKDLLALERFRQSWPCQDALKFISENGSGVLVLLTHEEPAEVLTRRLIQLQNQQYPERSLRFIGSGARILKHLGLQKMRVMSAPKRFHALSGFGLEVVEYVQQEVTHAIK